MTRQDFETTDVLRLEVQVPPTGLYNMVANPDGALGGWGWITPVSGSVMTGDATGLFYTSPNPSAASYFYSEPMPITAGEYAAAAWTLVSLFSVPGYVRVRFEWLDSNYAVLSSSTQSGYLNTLGPAAYAAQLAPASTAFVRLRFDHYYDTSGANPLAGSGVKLTDVKVAKASTSGALAAVIRTNLVTNPSFEVNLTGWAATDSSTTAVRTTAVASVGIGALHIYRSFPNPGLVSAQTTVPVTGGSDYVLQARFRTQVSGGAPRLAITWLDSSGTTIGTPTTTGATSSTTTFNVHTLAATAPGNATQARLAVQHTVPGPGNASGAYVDAVAFTAGTDTPTYWDGTTSAAGTKSYAWTGTAHASTSTMTDTTLGSLVGTEWRNVLGSSHEIVVQRESLNLGTLSAVVLDATVDPSQTDDLRPGRRVRLLALSDDVWEPIFTGKATRIDVEYDEKAVPPKPPRISLTAVDSTQILAAVRRPEGVGAIADLPWVLEGAGVPWSVNGAGTQVPSATVASTNDNATALDQVALTRDTALGFAWIDRRGVLVVEDYDASPTVVATLDESVYSDIDLSFSSEDCTNSIDYKWLVLNTVTGNTDEYHLTGYEDTASIEEWGRRHQTFTIHGSAANAAAHAASVLARNATPAVRVNTVSIPIKVTGDISTSKALLDLGSVVTVENAAKSIDQDLRVLTVTHRITPEKWMVDLSFTRPTSVAAPQVVPPVR